MSGGLLYEKAVIIVAKNDPKCISMFALLRISSHTHVHVLCRELLYILNRN